MEFDVLFFLGSYSFSAKPSATISVVPTPKHRKSWKVVSADSPRSASPAAPASSSEGEKGETLISKSVEIKQWCAFAY